jgi:FixJ family two-component response regulator
LREREVLPLVVHGLLNKQVAAQLGISEVTIKVHRSRIMKKMRARSLPELVRMVEKLNRAAPHLQRERGAIPKGR